MHVNQPSSETKGRRRLVRSVLLATSMMTAASAAAAQDQPAPARTGVDVITVTAQKRSENVQDVPISIIALGTEKLDELQVSQFSDYAKFIPSLTFQSTGPNSTTVYFRGVVSGGDGNHSASLPSVGVYLDEQPVTTILGFLPVHIYDIERVEGVAGPQGTLYGASAQSGVLRIITNKPDTSGFSAGYDLEGNYVEHGDAGYQFEGFVNQPISDNAAIRLVGYYKKDAGYIDNVLGEKTFPGSGISRDNAALVENNFNDVETFGARAALKIDLNDSWTVTPAVLAQKSRSHGVHFYDPDTGDLDVVRFEPEFNTDRFVQASLTLEGKIGDFDLVYAGAYLRRQIDSNYDYTDYAYYYDVLYQSFGPGYNFSEYFYDNMYNLIDPSQFYQGDDSYGKYSNEIRLSSPQDRRLRFVVGFFQNYQRHDIHQQYIVRDLADILEVPDHPDTIWLTEQQRIDRDLALFTEVEFDLTDRLTLVGGVRGYKYKNSLIGFNGYGIGFSGSTGEAACFGPPSVPDSPCTNLDSVQKNTGETHKISLKYDVDDSKMVYLTYSTGFRPGGANRRTPLPPYLEDKLVNYEAGFKTGWADNTFVLNGAFFYQKWKDFQFPILGLNGLTEVQNAAQARIYGFEADMTWAPTDRFTLNGAVSVIDAELSENFCGYFDANRMPVTDCPFPVDDPLTDDIDETADPEAPKGTPLPVVPKFKGTITARYEFPVGAMTGHLQSSVSGQTTSPSNLLVVDQQIIGDQEGFVLVDFTAGLRKDKWRMEAYLTNAFDERPDLYSFVACPIETCGVSGPSGTNGIYNGTARPRTYGIRFGQEF
ncbi:MAG: TonB-dependent receptor [Pseudomonadota bacterium]|nr:TonB-dependent receptor [Pseudomonadota bacterium]